MDLQTYLDQNKITKYHLSQVSGVPKTTIMDICAGRSDISRCSAKTVQQLAKALKITMEDVMGFGTTYDSETGLPKDNSYLECGLPGIPTGIHSGDESCMEKTGPWGGIFALGL